MRLSGLPVCGFAALFFLIPPAEGAAAKPAAKKSTPAKTAAAKPKTTANTKPTTDKAGVQEHVVKKGETLWSISQKYSTSVGEVMELNKMSKESVRDGMKLKIPPREAAVDPRKARRKVHVVDDDETFWSIANQYNISAEALANANPNVNPNRLHPDMELIVPPPDPNQPAKPATPPKPPVTLKPSETLADVTRPSTPVANKDKEKETAPTKPTPEPPATSAPVSGAEHVIAEGDTFYALARRYKVPMEAIVAANPSVNPRRMKNGTKVIIPDKAVTSTPAKAPEKPAITETKTEPAKPAVAAKVAPPAKPLPPLPGPNALPIPKPKVTALTSEPVKKQLPPTASADKEKPAEPAKSETKPKSGQTSPVLLAAPTPRVTVNPPMDPAPSKLDHDAPAVSAPPSTATKPTVSVHSAPPGPKGPSNTVGSDGVIRSYIVSDGETESSISEDFGISKEQLYEYNRLPATAKLKPGDEIMIPRVAKIKQ